MTAFRMTHTNINITDVDKSLDFYQKALGLHVIRRLPSEDGAFEILYLSDADEQYELELTWLRDHPQAYNLGENEWHIAFCTEDFEQAHALHQKMGCICYENPEMGIYFIQDPDGYWLEVVPPSL